MIKNIKDFGGAALARQGFREYAENYESELIRGISTVIILRIIEEQGAKGAYGYMILKDIKERTNGMLVLEEGTLYPMLRKLEKDGILQSERQDGDEGRPRKYYSLTGTGTAMLGLMAGFMAKLIEAVAPLSGITVSLGDEHAFCPNCTSKIAGARGETKCATCGYNLGGAN